MTYEAETGISTARKISEDWYRQHGNQCVQIARAEMEILSVRGEAEGWTPKQYQDALSELVQKKTDHLLLTHE
jgi:hypothetical protein